MKTIVRNQKEWFVLRASFPARFNLPEATEIVGGEPHRYPAVIIARPLLNAGGYKICCDMVYQLDFLDGKPNRRSGSASKAERAVTNRA